MPKKHAFTIYNASAGSGKTYTLVKEYLKILFHSNNQYLFKNILAITFTNKAVAEMKDRIIDTLKQFSNVAILENPSTMFNTICDELNIEPKKLHGKASKLLNTIIHNYAAFDISTIDGFTHKLIRTFAHDLKLPLNFEVELDQDALLNEAVDSLIAKAGTDKALTKILVDFAIEKADDDKSWDVSFDFNKIAKLLVNENDIPFIEKLKDKTLEDFKTLKNQLQQEVSSIEINLVEKAESILALIEETGLEFNDFSGGYLPKHFKKLAGKTFNIKFEAKWQENIESKTLYPKRVSNEIASIIEQIQPQIASVFNDTKHAIFNLKFHKNFYKTITPLSVLNAINNELNILKIEQNKMLISEFNSIISKEISKQPTPFIYERLGEKFKYYFIDEFQDTSQTQWENLIPLLDNSLSGVTGKTMIVGDAKQAIYRWRGGKAEQFLNLLNLYANPFVVTPKNINLETNWRSQKEIINFNNSFFNFIANKLSNSNYKNLYKDGNKQKTSSEDNGYVALLFASKNTEEEEDSHCIKTLEVLEKVLEKKYSLGDICILVRDNKKGAAIADFITKKGYAVISPDSLLLANDKSVSFLVSLLQYIENSDNNEAIYAILDYLYDKTGNKHDFIAKNLITPSILLKEKYGFKIDTIKSLSTYDILEQAILHFKLAGHSDGHLSHFMDEVFDYSQKEDSSIFSFLNYWSHKSGTLSVKRISYCNFSICRCENCRLS